MEAVQRSHCTERPGYLGHPIAMPETKFNSDDSVKEMENKRNAQYISEFNAKYGTAILHGLCWWRPSFQTHSIERWELARCSWWTMVLRNFTLEETWWKRCSWQQSAAARHSPPIHHRCVFAVCYPAPVWPAWRWRHGHQDIGNQCDRVLRPEGQQEHPIQARLRDIAVCLRDELGVSGAGVPVLWHVLRVE